jgi:RNA recognition motif-containing protein
MAQYNDVMREGFPDGGASSLKSRLVRFRKWAAKDAKISVHSAMCVVNGEATDGTRNAPVLLFESPRGTDASGGGVGGGTGMGGSSSNKNGGGGSTMMGGIGGVISTGGSGLGGIGMGGGSISGGGGGSGAGPDLESRCGDVDGPADRAMYERTIGCQVRTVRDVKGDEVALSVPLSAMITPDIIASSDAGRAIFSCCFGGNGGDDDANNTNLNGVFWGAFGPTGKLEQMQAERIRQNSGTQLLVKILQERKKVETIVARHERDAIEAGGDKYVGGRTVPVGSISYRAPYLAFLIHQRFANDQNPPVATTTRTGRTARGGVDPPLPPPSLPEGVPATFAPYVRTLPSSVCSPICWKRNELAILAGCIPGMPALQSVAARTMQLASELTALVEVGLLRLHTSVFSPGMITWDRWVWAAAVYESRVMQTSYLPRWMWNDENAVGCSPTHVWESAGVMIPFVDMMNHIDDLPQARWRQSNVAEDASARKLSFYIDEKTKKHCQIYRNYGAHDNEAFMLQYGFTRIGNPTDMVRIAWALTDGVGGVAPPVDYDPVSEFSGVPSSHLVFDSMDPIAIKEWWTEQRIALLGKATSNNTDALESLRKGKSIRFKALNNGKIDNMLIAVAVVSTISPKLVDEMFHKSANNPPSKPLGGLTLDRTAQNVARLYLSFLFSKKLGKLLQSLNSCLKDHFDLNQLWTKASLGGLNYVARKDENISTVDGGGEENFNDAMGWQTFFDTFVYLSSMEVETGSYYAMAPKSCVLTLYDGHVKSLQKSLDIMATEDLFYDCLKMQLEGLGCFLDRTTVAASSIYAQPIVTPASATVSEKETEERIKPTSIVDENRAQDPAPPIKDEHGNGQRNVNKRDRDHQVKDKSKVDQRRPAIKLHIGNLSYKTQPNNLYDFFTDLYGEGSVLECHIPTERETGHSRGFGFVTMPDNHAKSALEPGRKHEMDGRILKVAESNSAGSVKGTKQNRSAPPAPSSDRCPNCGYRPRWCTCNPNIPMAMGMGPPPLDIYGPGPYVGPPLILGGPGYGRSRDMEERRVGGDGYGWGGGGGGSGNRRSHSHTPSYRRDRDRGHRRSPSYSRSRSRSYSRGRDRDDRYRGRNHGDRRRYEDGDDRKRYDDDRRRGSSRRYRSKSRSRSRHRDNAVSPNRGRLNGEIGDFSDEPEEGRSLSRSRSPTDDSGMDRPSTSKKREGKDSGGRGGERSRSRDRGSRRRKRSAKGSRRVKESSSKRRGGSRSRSRERH